MKKIVLGAMMLISLLASAGKPVYTVILPDNPGLTEKKAADEIRIHLQKLADVVIVTGRNGAKGKRIVIRAVDPKMDVEEWSLKGADADEIILSGGKRGIVYAAFELLERLAGVLWLDEYTTYGPEKLPVWEKGYSLHGKPSFPFRSVYTYFSGKPSRVDFACRSRQNFFLNEKLTPQKMSYGLTPMYGSPRDSHTEYEYTSRWPKDTPMEYFSLTAKHGKRVRATSPMGPGTICLSNKDMRKRFLEDLRNFIRQDRVKFAKIGYPKYYVITYNDTYDPCICENCLKKVKELGNMTALSLDFMNELARGIRDEFPDVVIRCSAYFYTQTPPPKEFRIEPNIIVGIAQMGTEWIGGDRTRRDSLRPLSHPNNAKAKAEFIEWSSRAAALAVSEYWIAFEGKGLLTENSASVAENLKFNAAHRVKITFSEAEYPLQVSFHPLRVWLGRRLMNDVTLDAKTETDRFMKAYFGKASPEMEELRQMIVRENASVTNQYLTCPLRFRSNLNADYFTKAENLLNAALAKAAEDEELRRKILRERLQFDLCRLQLDSIPAALQPGRETVKKRALEDFLLLAPRYYTGKNYKLMVDSVKAIIDRDHVKITPLKDFPDRKVAVRYVGSAITPLYNYGGKLEKDPAAENGYANTIVVNEPRFLLDTFMVGYYDQVSKKTFSRIYPAEKIPKDGKYHWYSLGNVKLSRLGYAFAHRTWKIQLQLDEFYDAFPDNEVEILYRVRLEYDSAKSGKIRKVWVDQIALLLPAKSVRK